MSLADRLYSLALRAYPRDFRDENREEVLGTLADLREAGTSTGPIRQVISLSYNGNRLRWLHATGGSVSRTLRQGLAWGVLLLIARQVGLGLQDIVRRSLNGAWGHIAILQDQLAIADIGLTMGWLIALVLLARGRRRRGQSVLGAVMAGYLVTRILLALAYGGPFSWPFTLHFFLPTLLPLVCVLLWPKQPMRISGWTIGVLVVFAYLIPTTTAAFGPGGSVLRIFGQYADPALSRTALWGIELGLCLAAGVLVLLLSLSDPRWAVAVSVVTFVPLIRGFVPGQFWLDGGGGFQTVEGVVMIGVLVPLGALLLSLWARRRALPRRAC